MRWAELCCHIYPVAKLLQGPQSCSIFPKTATVLFIGDNLWVELLSLGFAPDVRSTSGLELENTGVNAPLKTHLKLVLFSLWRASGRLLEAGVIAVPLCPCF